MYLFRARERPGERKNSSIVLPFDVGRLPAGSVLMKAARDDKRGMYLWFGSGMAGERVVILEPGGKKEVRREVRTITSDGIVRVDSPGAVVLLEKDAILSWETINKIDARELTREDIDEINKLPGLLLDILLKKGDFSAKGTAVQKFYAFMNDARCGKRIDIVQENKLTEIKTWARLYFDLAGCIMRPRRVKFTGRENITERDSRLSVEELKKMMKPNKKLFMVYIEDMWNRFRQKLREGMNQLLGYNMEGYELYSSAFTLLPPGGTKKTRYGVGIIGMTLKIPGEIINAAGRERKELIRKHVEKYRNSFIEGVKKFLMEEYEPGEIKVGPPLVEREMMVPEYDLDIILLEANTKTIRLRDEKDRLKDEKSRLEREIIRLQNEKDRLKDEKDRLKDRIIEIVTSGKGNIEEVRAKIAEVERKIKETEGRISDIEGRIREVERKIKETEGRISDVERKIKEVEGCIKEVESKIKEVESEREDGEGNKGDVDVADEGEEGIVGGIHGDQWSS